MEINQASRDQSVRGATPYAITIDIDVVMLLVLLETSIAVSK